MSRRAAGAVLVGLALAGGCTATDTIAATGEPAEDLPTYCAQGGASVLVDGTCTGALAADVFRHALCGCQALGFAGDVITDGYDSRVAPYSPGGYGGHLASRVGVDGAAGFTIGGELTVAGTEGVEAGARLEVGGDLTTSGPLGRSSSDVAVGGSARLGGDVDVATLTVGGTLTTAPGATITGTVNAAAQQTAAVSVPSPCRCEEAVDVAGIVADHAVFNHDAEIGLRPDALVGVVGDTTLELPCGRFYLDEVTGSGAGTIVVRATGRTVLVIGGNVTAAQGLTLEVAADAELDVVIGGTIQVGGPLRLGMPERPRALRVYVGAGGSINLPDGSLIAANLHAPRADLALTGPGTELYGAIVVARTAGGGAVTAHHDRAISDAAAACE